MTVSHPTPIRNIRQCLAEINKSKLALQESYYKVEKLKIEVEKLKRKLNNETDELEIKLLNIRIEEKQVQIYNITQNQNGAIRRVSNYIEQIKSIKQSYNLDNFTEKDFEEEEEKYHIMKAFEQAITAARSRNGVIDEGNHIYFLQIGINGALAQKYVYELFKQENEILSKGAIPSPSLVFDFLNEMAVIFKGCSKFVVDKKGMNFSDISVIGE